MTENSVQSELVIAASPETVWQFLVDPERAVRWMGQAVSFDTRPGGIYRVDVLPGSTALGEFVEIDPPRRLVFTWGWEAGPGVVVPPGSSTVEFELLPEGDGTRVRFTHRDLPDSEATQRHAHGWSHYLARLAEAASGADPGPDPWLTEGVS